MVGSQCSGYPAVERFVRGHLYLLSRTDYKGVSAYMLGVFLQNTQHWMNYHTLWIYRFHKLVVQGWATGGGNRYKLGSDFVGACTVREVAIRELPKFLNGEDHTPLFKQLLADPDQLKVKLRRKRIQTQRLRPKMPSGRVTCSERL